ncbi:hypothetical protein MAR_012772 [Mya arenaria]|uniref:Uncharacterized protein n=1 Tax=Mya arenaria TaxID=6604 RepID=A0ABY7G1S3_MYAAR|nr:hypothetical protein MAR_012772 [Mya arenaria]
MKYIDEESFTNINALRKFRNEINQYLDKREQELLEEIEQKKQKSQSLLSELKSNCQDIQAATEKLKVELQAKEVNSNQLFISGTRAIKELVGFQSALKDIRGKKCVSYFKFTRDPTTKQLLASCTAIGRVDQVASDLADHVASDLADQVASDLADQLALNLADQQTKPQVSGVYGEGRALSLLYAGQTVLGALVLYIWLPETKGKSLEEVESLFAQPWCGTVNGAD